MAHALSSRRTLAMLTTATLVVACLPSTGPALAAPGHTTVVSTVPSTQSPDIIDGNVLAIHDAGSKIIAGGSFTQVQNRGSDETIIRNYILAFDKASGEVDAAFAPVVDGKITALSAGPTAGTVYLAGKFNTVNGVTRRKLALVNVADGSLVTSFQPPALNGLVNDIARTADRLFITGIFTSAGTASRLGLASLDPNTGALDDYLTTELTEHHNWNGSGAQAGVGGEKLALSPDGRQLVVIGNFKKADGVVHDQVVKLDLGDTAATIADWNTDGYQPRCAYWAFDSYVRDVAFSPDGQYFVIGTTGGGFTGTLCDSAARFEADATGTNVQPTWVTYSGGDTFLSVGISEQAVYVGGHIRWLNNSLGRDAARAGAVPRPSIAALDPVNGLPLSWNPGRHPRGYGVTELLVTPDGLWLGSDTSWLGNYQYRRERIAFIPLSGGQAPHPTTTADLPGHVYQAGVSGATNVLYRVNAGGPLLPSQDLGPAWLADTKKAPSDLHNVGSSASTFTAVGSIDDTVPATTPTAVFSSERWDPSDDPSMQWDFPVTAGTEVEVRLYLANRYAGTTQPGQRKFDVWIDDEIVLDDFDVVAAVGHDKGTMRSFTVVSDGNVDIDFGHVVNNPIISAIEIVKTGPLPPWGVGDAVAVRSYDGQTGVGAPVRLTDTSGIDWSEVTGAFWVGGSLFYALNGSLYRVAYDGNEFGTPSNVDPYHSPIWDNVQTGSGPAGQTYAGVTVNFYAELADLTGVFYSAGRIYYTLDGEDGLYWRWFQPDSGIVGADKFTVTGASGFDDAAGLFLADDTLYLVQRDTGNLVALDWSNGSPSGTPQVLSGPEVDGVDWRAQAVFIGPKS